MSKVKNLLFTLTFKFCTQVQDKVTYEDEHGMGRKKKFEQKRVAKPLFSFSSHLYIHTHTQTDTHTYIYTHGQWSRNIACYFKTLDGFKTTEELYLRKKIKLPF